MIFLISQYSFTPSFFEGVDLVTEADTRVEKVITQMIQDAFPNDIIIGEEDQAETAAGKQDELFPTGRIWCGELLQLICSVICICDELSYVYYMQQLYVFLTTANNFIN